MKCFTHHLRIQASRVGITILLYACSPCWLVSGASLVTNLIYHAEEQVISFEVETDSPSYSLYQGTTVSNIQAAGTGVVFPPVSGLKHYAPAQFSTGFYRILESSTDRTLSSIVPSLVGKTYQAGGTYYRFDDATSGKQYYGGSSEYDFTYTLDFSGPGVAQIQFHLADQYREYLTLYLLESGGGLLRRIINEGPGGQILFSPASLSETTAYGSYSGVAPASLVGPSWSITLGSQDYPVTFTSETEVSFPEPTAGNPVTVQYEYIRTGTATATLRIFYPGESVRTLWLSFNNAGGTSADIFFPAGGFSFNGSNLAEGSLNIPL